MLTSGLIWITGYSASGKTTVGRNLRNSLYDSGKRNVIFLDGDDLRSIFAHKWGFDRADRIELVKVYLRFCSHLVSQGNIVILSTIGLYADAFDWVREYIYNPLIVFLSVPTEVRLSRDSLTKKVYKKSFDITSVYDTGLKPDLVLDNRGEQPISQIVSTILQAFHSPTPVHRDIGRSEYWNSFYQDIATVPQTSSFALLVKNFLDSSFSEYVLKSSRLFDFGCQLAVDSFYFSQYLSHVDAYDHSATAIAKSRQFFEAPNLHLFSNKPNNISLSPETYDFTYSCFGLNYITSDEEDIFLNSAFQSLRSGGHIFLNCMSTSNSLCRSGDIIGHNERLAPHYIRFIDFDLLRAKINHLGFVSFTAPNLQDTTNLLQDESFTIFARKS